MTCFTPNATKLGMPVSLPMLVGLCLFLLLCAPLGMPKLANAKGARFRSAKVTGKVLSPLKKTIGRNAVDSNTLRAATATLRSRKEAGKSALLRQAKRVKDSAETIRLAYKVSPLGRRKRAARIEAPAEPAPGVGRILTGRKDALATRLGLIRNAKSEVNFSTFNFSNDRVGKLMLAELRRASLDGKKVRMLLDGVGHRLPDVALKSLLEAGVEISVYNEKRLSSFLRPHEISYRMHEKILVVDKSQVIIGGRNIEDGYFGFKNDKVVQFHDTEIVVTGKTAGAAESHYMALWKSANVTPFLQESLRVNAKELSDFGKDLDKSSRYNDRVLAKPTQGQRPETSLASVRFINEGTKAKRKDKNRTRSVVLKMIDKAKSNVEIQSTYLIPDRQLLRSVKAATKRGVRVRFITNSWATADKWYPYLGFLAGLESLAKVGAEVWEYTGERTIHSKTVVADGHRVFISSHNIDPRSANLNREVGVLIRSKEVAGQIKSDGAKQISRSELVAKGGKITDYKIGKCGAACSWIYRAVLNLVLRTTGVYWQL